MGQQLPFKRKHRGIVTIHGPWSRISKTSRLNLKGEVSRTEKKVQDCDYMFLGRRQRSREESPEWICESRCRQVSVRLHVCICGIFWPLNLSTTTVYARSAFYPSLHFTLSL